MSVVITPVIIAFLERKMPERKMLLSAFAALAGLFLLTCDLKSFSVNAGDLFALGNAVFFSAFLAGLKFYSKKVEAVHFTFIHHGTNTVAFMTIAGIFELKYINPEKLAAPPFALLISASVLISIITVLLQSSSIKFVRAEKATLIYTLEPVTASILAFFFIGERLNGIGAFIGCCLILAAVVYSVFKPGRKGKRSYDAEPSISPLTE
jgi:drug/metabolite transporter (DMT)-like permease